MEISEQIVKQMKYDGVERWHKKGITGKNVVVWNMENASSGHGFLTRCRVLDSAPDATVINVSLSMASNNVKVHYARVNMTDGTVYEVEDFIKTFNVKILTRSVGGEFCSGDSPAMRFWEDLKKRYNLVILNCYGNEGDKQKPEKDITSILVGACGFYKIDGKEIVKRDAYSSTGEGIDFMDFRGDISANSGTSFSTPYLAGKVALLCEKYGNKAVTQEFAYQYFKDHAEDLEKKEFDTYTGWGLPKMGDEKTVITFAIGSKELDVDGRTIVMDNPAHYNTKGDRVEIEAKFIADAFVCETVWDEATKTGKFIK